MPLRETNNQSVDPSILNPSKTEPGTETGSKGLLGRTFALLQAKKQTIYKSTSVYFDKTRTAIEKTANKILTSVAKFFSSNAKSFRELFEKDGKGTKAIDSLGNRVKLLSKQLMRGLDHILAVAQGVLSSAKDKVKGFFSPAAKPAAKPAGRTPSDEFTIRKEWN